MRRMIWGIAALVYFSFAYWYTDFEGPLSEAEIATAVARLQQGSLSADRVAVFEHFMRTDTGRQFVMFNALDLADKPRGLVDGQPMENTAASGESAAQLMARYMEHMYPQMLMRASHPVFFGQVVSSALDIYGIENVDVWDQGALVRYRSRRDFMEIVLHPDMGNRHQYKLAALDKTVAFPVEVELTTGDPRLLLALFILALTALVDSFFLTRRRATHSDATF